MGNFESTANTANTEIGVNGATNANSKSITNNAQTREYYSGVDVRPIDKDAQNKLIIELEKMLSDSLGLKRKMEAEQKKVEQKKAEQKKAEAQIEAQIKSQAEKTAVIETSKTAVIETSKTTKVEDDFKDQKAEVIAELISKSEATIPQKPIRKITIEKSSMLKALLEAEKHNADLTIADLREQIETNKSTHQAEITVLRSVLTQRENDIADLKKKLSDSEQSAHKWRNFYFEASFTNRECINCNKPIIDFSEIPRPSIRRKPRTRVTRPRPKPFVGFNTINNEDNYSSNQIYNISTNGRIIDNSNIWSNNVINGAWGNKDTWGWENAFDTAFIDLDNKTAGWETFVYPSNV